MGHSGSDSKKSLSDAVFLITILIYTAAIAYLIYWIFASGSFPSVRDNLLQLTESDVAMIPVGALAFFVFWRVFDNLVFSRHLELLELREESTTGASESASEIKKEILIKEEEIQAQILSVRRELNKKNEAEIKIKEQERQNKINAKSAKIKEKLKAEQESLVKKELELKETLFKDADSMVNDLVSKLTDTSQIASLN